MSQAISNLAAGSLVRDPNTTFYGAPIVWKIADHNHAGFPANSTTVIAAKILTSHMVDGKEPQNADSNRQQHGNNRWKFSNLRQWLNKSAAANTWYEAQHAADTPPTDANGYYAAFGYDDEAGFLAGFSADFINNLLDTTYTVELASVDGGGSEQLTDKIFLANKDMVGLGSGGAFPIFTDNTSRIGYYTDEGVAYHNKEITDHGLSLSPITSTTARYWWLCDTYASFSYYVRGVYASGALLHYDAICGYIGVRPLCNLNSSILVSDTPDANGVYDIEFATDTAPHISGADTDQGNIYGGFDYEYSVTDGGGDTVTVVEAVDGVTVRSYTVTLEAVNQFGLSRQAWLALSYGSHTATITATDTESQSETRTVTFTKHQAAPTISGSDGSLGEVVGSVSYDYTVNDLNGVDGDTVTVVETLDGTQKRSYTVTLGATNTFSIPAADWGDVAYGNHTIVITATDSYGVATTRTETFIKRNYSPAISGSDSDLGTKTGDFEYGYTIYDNNFAEGDTVTVVEKLNGATKRTYTVNAQTTSSFAVGGETFLRLANSSHTLTITATDAKGETVTRTVTFTKQQSISVTLAEAIPNDGDQTARPVEAVVNLEAYVPAGASIEVLICNNGFDDSPTYEDCTVEAVNGQKHIFTNEEKTAAAWGVNVRVTITKGTATATPTLKQVSVKFKY